MGVGFPLFLMGTLVLFAGNASSAAFVVSAAAVVVGLGLFFDPR
jgi:hypothetical protein